MPFMLTDPLSLNLIAVIYLYVKGPGSIDDASMPICWDTDIVSFHLSNLYYEYKTSRPGFFLDE